MSFEQTFKRIDNILRLEVPTALDYTEQTSWILFLRYLDGLEQDKSDEAELMGKSYQFILDEVYRWSNWAMPKNDKGELDHHKAMTGPDLIDFVDKKLFPYLASFREKASTTNTIEYKIGEIFYEVKNKVKSGYNLRDILEAADELPFNTSDDKHELSALYEEKIREMGNAGRNGGEYYTPRPLIRAMIEVTQPKIGERIYDGAAGSCGFLCEAYEYLKKNMSESTDNLHTLQESTFYGKEKKSLAYVVGIMNMSGTNLKGRCDRQMVSARSMQNELHKVLCFSPVSPIPISESYGIILILWNYTKFLCRGKYKPYVEAYNNIREMSTSRNDGSKASFTRHPIQHEMKLAASTPHRASSISSV